MNKKSFAFDFDGVIANYEGFQGIEHTGEPIEEVAQAIRELHKRGHTIILHSTRGSEQMRAYCQEHDIPVDHYNENPEYDTGNPGKPVASVYVDDRTVCYEGQSKKKLIDQLESFKPHWE